MELSSTATSFIATSLTQLEATNTSGIIIIEMCTSLLLIQKCWSELTN